MDSGEHTQGQGRTAGESPGTQRPHRPRGDRETTRRRARKAGAPEVRETRSSDDWDIRPGESRTPRAGKDPGTRVDESRRVAGGGLATSAGEERDARTGGVREAGADPRTPTGSAVGAPAGEARGRTRDARGTRLRILHAAGAVFAERGYEAATVRDIAARAGVNQALIFRYFGSKKALLAEVMAQDGREQVSTTPPERLFETALRGVLAEGGGAGADRLLAVYLRSIGSADAAPETVRLLGEEYAGALAALSPADDGTLRAQLAMAWLLGIGLMRVVVGQEPLASAAPDDVCAHVLTALDRLLPVLPAEGATDVRP